MTEIFRRDQVERAAPKTAEEIERAARDLADAGHSDYNIAAILRTNINAVRAMIGPAKGRGIHELRRQP